VFDCRLAGRGEGFFAKHTAGSFDFPPEAGKRGMGHNRAAPAAVALPKILSLATVNIIW